MISVNPNQSLVMVSQHRYFLILFTFFLAVSCRKYWLYAGAGGCSAADPNCTQPPPIDQSTIYILEFDSITGNISLNSKKTGFAPIWFLVHPSNRFLFSVTQDSVGVVSMAINARTGDLTVINSVKAHGDPVFITTDPQGRNLFVACYGAGTVGIIPVDPNTGKLGT